MRKGYTLRSLKQVAHSLLSRRVPILFLRLVTILLATFLCLPTVLAQQATGRNLSSAEILAIIEVPDPVPKTHTVRVASTTNDTHTATFVVKNVTSQRWEYEVTEVLTTGGFEWLRVISYSGVVESLSDARNSGRDVVEFLTFCPEDPLQFFGDAYSVSGDIVVRLKDPNAGSAEQRVRIELSCAPRASISIPVVPGPRGPVGAPGSSGRDGAPGPVGVPGAPGRNGAPGPVGAPGAPGSPGPVGSPGRNGAPGPVGAPGAPGPQGSSGISCWDTNRNGANEANEDRNRDGRFDSFDCQGSSGPAGAPGRNGAPGPVGPVGAPGSNGAPGLNGAPGPVGAPGAPGAPGRNGAPGQ